MLDSFHLQILVYHDCISWGSFGLARSQALSSSIRFLIELWLVSLCFAYDSLNCAVGTGCGESGVLRTFMSGWFGRSKNVVDGVPFCVIFMVLIFADVILKVNLCASLSELSALRVPRRKPG